MDMDDPLDFEFEDQLISSSLVTKKRFYSPTSISFLSFTTYPYMVLCNFFYFGFHIMKLFLGSQSYSLVVCHCYCNYASGFLEIFTINNF